MSLALIKLTNGTELVGDVQKTTVGLKVTDPLQINYKFVSFQPMPTVGVSRYMPFAATPVFSFTLDQIVHVVDPTPAMVQYYAHALGNYRDDIDGHIEDELMRVVGKTSIKKSSNKEDLYAALLDRMEPEGPLN
jgi:hypothetical protein